MLLRLLVLPLVLIKVARGERWGVGRTRKTGMDYRDSESIDKFEEAANRVQRRKRRPAQAVQQQIVAGSLISLIILAAKTD